MCATCKHLSISHHIFLDELEVIFASLSGCGQVITYEQPSFGSHHFSLTSWCNFDQVNASLKKPRWVPELYEERALAQMVVCLCYLSDLFTFLSFVSEEIDYFVFKNA